MAHNPMPALVFVISSRLLVAFVGGVAPELFDLEACTGWWDVATGCASLTSILLGAAVGIVPGAPGQFNTLLLFISNSALVWAVVTLIRGN